jgi:Acetyltransferase (GNAT) domain
MVMRIVHFEGQPFAYAQDYDVPSWPQPHFAGLPAGTRAIDAFIGEPKMLERGHGARFLRLLCRGRPLWRGACSDRQYAHQHQQSDGSTAVGVLDV